MYITAVQESNCAGGAAAWAQPCLLDLGDDRPLVGGANVCPSALRLLDEEQMVAVLAHEIIHALVGAAHWRAGVPTAVTPL